MAERNALLRGAAESIIRARDAQVAKELLYDQTRPLFSEAYQLLDRVLPKKEPSPRDQFRKFSFMVKSEGTIMSVKVVVSREKESFAPDGFKIDVDGLAETLVVHKAGATIRIRGEFDKHAQEFSHKERDPSLEEAQVYLDLVRRIAKR